jgi:cold shock CspA family protein
MEGTISFFSQTKGFGFIAVDNSETKVFVHISAVERAGLATLTAGQRVRFGITSARQRVSAVELRLDAEAVAPTPPIEIQATLAPGVIEIPRWPIETLMLGLKESPQDIYTLSPGVFEEVVAAILRDEGYDARILSHCYEPDGGLDILAIEHRVGNVETRFAVQCKRYKRERKVGVQPIRELAAVLDRHRVHQGMIVTTSFFTRNAMKEADTYFWRITLRDYDNVVASLLRYGLGGAPGKLASDRRDDNGVNGSGVEW